ncbi:MAG: SOS response-associated peptidase [Alphaproteobacteria bacterium]|nr:SOS response-associated peptidase [Alphaproteobacteria bacterium]
MFGKREINDPAKVLRLHAQEWSRNEALRISPRRRWDGDPTAKRMVVHRRDVGELALTPMRWGLVPEWRRSDPERQPLISVRSEAIVETVDWRRLLNTHRCIVPSDQFYEWKRVAGVKTREYTFRLRNGRPLMIAALWGRSPSPTGRLSESFAYVTCEANRMISLIHDRMPVILDDAGIAAWLNPNASLESLIALMHPLASMELEMRPVNATAPAAARPYQPSLFPRAA